jgi:hypothetical protein
MSCTDEIIGKHTAKTGLADSERQTEPTTIRKASAQVAQVIGTHRCDDPEFHCRLGVELFIADVKAVTDKMT